MTNWFITGASRGLGLAIAQAALEQGDTVAVTGRDQAALRDGFAAYGERAIKLLLDLRDPQQINDAVARAHRVMGSIDVLVNNAGYGQLGVFEEVSRGAVSDEFETNVYGTMDMLRSVLPIMRTRRGGHVFNISSIGGITGFAGAGVYSASKFAIEGLSESLAQELAPLGITVTIVSPGYFRTDFLDAASVRWGEEAIADYREMSGSNRQFHEETNHNQPGDPAKLGAAIVELARRERPPLRFVAGSDAYELAHEAYESRLRELLADEALSRSTDFEPAAV